MSKIVGYTGNCGHWIQVDINIYLNCVRNGKILLPNGNMIIKGIGKRCQICFPDANDDEIVIYARKANTISVRPIEIQDYCKLFQACIS
jgi:hypothetical protein